MTDETRAKILAANQAALDKSTGELARRALLARVAEIQERWKNDEATLNASYANMIAHTLVGLSS